MTLSFIFYVFQKCLPAQAVHFVCHFFQYSPNLRYTALEACVHPFFDKLRDPNTHLPNGRPLPPLFNFKSQGEARTPGWKQDCAPVPGEAETPRWGPDCTPVLEEAELWLRTYLELKAGKHTVEMKLELQAGTQNVLQLQTNLKLKAETMKLEL
ncbi:unnamed protein product [Fraxinus pennsylvanica]|uniref:Uncharacterized protein n=1 Tax=Fraxinus pennsylvanica TaxID=56036 RepID=A0AAD1ZM92_9LAMI|nr:unnamed protein product [Fraxinus pennsylvanica]